MVSQKSQVASHKSQVIFLVGPTAVGKSALAIKLAKRINAEIISCDSMQVYKKMDILNAKPSKSLRKKTPHHLIDIVSPEKEYNVATYRQKALKLIKTIHQRNKIPLFVGGSGLYMSAILDGLFERQTENKLLRKRLYKEAEERGNFYLYKRLQKVDPIAAEKIHPHDLRRIVRALEVHKLTGKQISQLQRLRKGIMDDYTVLILGLNLLREKLYENIDQRVERMFKKGLVKEVKNLLKIKLSKTARQAIGIREIKGYLDGQYTIAEAKRLVQRNSRRFAKRQLTWFRKDNRIRWLDLTDSNKALKEIQEGLKTT